MRARAVLAGAAAAGVIGCGGTPLSTTDLRIRAARICRLATGQTDKIAAPNSPGASAAFLKRGIAVLKPELAELRALRPPRALAGTYSTSITSFSQKLGALEGTVRDLAGDEDPVIAVKLLQRELAPIESQENAAWQALQIPACVNR